MSMLLHIDPAWHVCSADSLCTIPLQSNKLRESAAAAINHGYSRWTYQPCNQTADKGVVVRHKWVR